LDACALIAYLSGEKGSEKIKEILQDAFEEKIVIKINQINLLEVYYNTIKKYDQNTADKILEEIEELPIEVIIGLRNNVFREAGRIKTKYKIPLGDAIAVVKCVIGNGILVTSDYNNFEIIEKGENITVNWFR
jgi:predicted nucleic acid-binding protein